MTAERVAAPSLARRLSLSMALVFLAGTVVLYAAARAYGHYAADRSYDRLLASSALAIAETLGVAEGRVQVDLPYAALDMLAAAPEDRVFYRVADPQGRTVTGYDDLPQSPAPPLRREATQQQARFFDASYRGERLRFAVLSREVAEPGVSGWIEVQVGQTRRARDALARELVVTALLPIVLLTLLALAAVRYSIARALAPLARLGAELSAREPSDLAPVSAPVPAEAMPLVEALDGFMQRLRSNIATLRAFIAEAAHQMRTPLAALRAQAAVALDEDDPAELRRSLHAVERNAARLTRLLNQLLSDATVIHRSDVRRFEALDLVDVVRQALREAVPLSGDGEVSLQASISEAPYSGDGLMLREALKNLVDNALRHGNPEQGSVEVALGAVPGGYRITIADRGPGIPPDQRERVFERFARGDSAAPGAGLGLAIVRRVVQSHGGEVSLEDRPGGGLLVCLHLPSAGVPA